MTHVAIVATLARANSLKDFLAPKFYPNLGGVSCRVCEGTLIGRLLKGWRFHFGLKRREEVIVSSRPLFFNECFDSKSSRDFYIVFLEGAFGNFADGLAKKYLVKYSSRS